MRSVVGIIGEYNPFHNGHKYHLEESKRILHADYSVAIISGNFVQRGNVSIIDKWSKAEMALNNGVDLVLELPTIYSVSSAENFALGSIKTLNALNIVDYLSFGSEIGNLDTLNLFSEIFTKQPSEYVSLLNHELSKGLSFPKARENAVLMYLHDIRKYSNILSSPNNILGIEYLKALKKTKSPIRPLTLKRENVEYNDISIKNNFASATSIREMLIKNKLSKLPNVMPKETYKVFYNSYQKGHIVKDLSQYEKEIIYTLRKMTLEEISNLPDVSEGLENNIKNAANSCNTLEEFMNIVKTKRYTSTRIKRILVYALLGITKKDMKDSTKNIPYVRVLGFNQKGKELLSVISNNARNIDIITSVKKYIDNNPSKYSKRMLDIDINATNIYTLGYEKDSWANLDFTHNMIIK